MSAAHPAVRERGIVKLIGRFYCTHCGKRQTFSRRCWFNSYDNIMLLRRCKCGSRWAEEGTAAP